MKKRLRRLLGWSRIHRRFFLVFLATAITSQAASGEEPPLNILLVIADDLGYADLSCAELAKDVETPNLDALASAGIRFTQAYATAPICNAARIALATGRYQQRQGQYWYSGPGLHDPTTPTLAEILKAHGYATGYIGKYHHGTNDALGERGFPLNHGFDRFFGFAGGTKHYLRHKREYAIPNDLLHQGPMWDQSRKKDVEGFTTELFGDHARAFLRENRNRPFFLTVSFNAVHNYTHQLPREYLKRKGLRGFADWDPSRQSYWEWREDIGYPAHPEGRDYYLGQLNYLDREIGSLLNELQGLGLRERTAILFIGDNGGSLVTYANNEPLKGGKYTLYEGGTRVPAILACPDRIAEGAVSDAVVSAMDFFPTLCSLAGADFPSNLDGRDLTWLLHGDSRKPMERPLYWDTQHQSAVRDGKWKLLVTRSAPNERLQIVDTPIGAFLFDLSVDPGETRNVIAEHPRIAETLRHKLEQWQAKMRQSQERLGIAPKPDASK